MNLIEYRDAIAAAHELHEMKTHEGQAVIADAHAELQQNIRRASEQFLGISFEESEAVEVEEIPAPKSADRRSSRSAFL